MMTTRTDPERQAEELIRTPDQRIRVFVSSTLEELADERVAVRAAIERLHLAPVMFELGARPHPPRDLYRAYLRQSHLFVGIYHRRYGWVAPGEDISGLEDEFRLSEGMPRLLYLKRPADGVEPRLQTMLDDLSDHPMVSYRHFAQAAELGALVESDIAAVLSERFMTRPSPPGASGGPLPRLVPAPVPLTPTVGREREVADVVRLLSAGVRLLTVTGPGGVGKTRLALEVARAARPLYADGVAFVPLEDVPSADVVMATIAAHLGIPEAGTRPILDRLRDEIGNLQLLLVLDNLEHLTLAATDLAALLAGCPALVALVTSRQSLHVRGEQEYPLAPLRMPGPASAETATSETAGAAPAVDLFVQRATAVNPGFRLTDENQAAVAAIVRLLDGLPLAIELAAARCRIFSPAALLARLTERLDLLAAESGDLPARHRTLMATLDWSYRLLTHDEQRLFARMSVFAGGAGLDAVESVCGHDIPDVLSLVSSLVDKSILVAEAADVPRVSMLHVVRAQASTSLSARGEADALAERHARWYADLAEPADILLHNDAIGHWPVLARDADNLLAAARWAVARADGAIMVQLARRLWPWLAYAGRVGELRDAVPQSADSADTDARTRRQLYLQSVAACYAQTQIGDHRSAIESAERAMRLADDAVDPQLALLEASLLLLRGTLGMYLGQTDAVEDDLTAALRLATREDNAWLTGHAALHHGVWRTILRDAPSAVTDLEHAVAIATAMGHDVLLAQAIGQLAILDLLEDRLESCLDRVTEQVRHLEKAHNVEGLATALDTMGAVAVRRHRYSTAARALAVAQEQRERIRLPIRPLTRDLHEVSSASVAESLGQGLQQIRTQAVAENPWRLAEQVLVELREPDYSA